MAAIAITYSVTSSHASQRRAKGNMTKPTAPQLHCIHWPYKVKCSTSSNLSRQCLPSTHLPLDNMSDGKPNMGSRSEEDSSVGAQPMTANGSGDSATDIRTIARLLDKSTKWVLLAILLYVVVWRHDSPEVLWAGTGCILNGASSQPLKQLINQPRPVSALGFRTDPGMPSSHAQNLAYFTAYALFILIGWQGLNTFTLGVAFAFITWTICMAWLRIWHGLHTYSQVIVGALIGFGGAILWFWIWNYMVLKMLNFIWRFYVFNIINLIFIVGGLKFSL